MAGCGQAILSKGLCYAIQGVSAVWHHCRVECSVCCVQTCVLLYDVRRNTPQHPYTKTIEKKRRGIGGIAVLDQHRVACGQCCVLGQMLQQFTEATSLWIASRGVAYALVMTVTGCFAVGSDVARFACTAYPHVRPSGASRCCTPVQKPAAAWKPHRRPNRSQDAGKLRTCIGCCRQLMIA